MKQKNETAMNIHVCLVFILIVSQTHGEFSFRRLTNGLIENPVVQLATQASGDVVANTLNVFSAIPNMVASLIGVYHIPTIENKYNVPEITDSFVSEYNNGLTNEDAKLNITDLIAKYGFPFEIHKVKTQDGYVLSMFRIPGNGSTVFLMHGLLGSADDYVIAGPESGLAYLLARDGYDVWMGNARGNKHSRIHNHLNPSQKEFWDFSWHEIGMFDLPAMVDYVLEETKSKTLKYVGHSQGTTAFFVMASERPEYNDKISVMVALSPVAYMSNMKSPVIRLIAPSSPFIESALKVLGVYEFLPDNLLVKNVKKAICGIGVVAEIVCSNVVFLVVGFDVAQLNVTNIPVFFGHLPSGASTKQLTHYSQGVISGEFAKFDYGSSTNEKLYGSRTAPKYDLDVISAPVALFFSDSDWLAQPTDVKKLSGKLKNIIEVYKVPIANFNHLDFLLAKDFKTIIYKRLQYILRLF